MEYINDKKFLEQIIEVQKVLKDWWYNNHEKLDPVSYMCDFRYTTVISELTKYPNEISVIDSLKNGTLIPLFTECHLRKFIEDKTNGLIQINTTLRLSGKREYSIFITYDSTPYSINLICDSVKSYDLLEALWICACKVARECLEKVKE